MALAKTDDSIAEIEGRIGGNVWRHDDAGQHVYAYTLGATRPPSNLQKKRRNAFQQCINFWNNIVTDTQRAEWQNYADNHPTTNMKGETIILTAYQAFMHINLYRAYNDIDLIASPPDD